MLAEVVRDTFAIACLNAADTAGLNCVEFMPVMVMEYVHDTSVTTDGVGATVGRRVGNRVGPYVGYAVGRTVGMELGFLGRRDG